MTKIIFYVTVSIMLLASKAMAQDTIQKGKLENLSFEKQAKNIATNIENITKEEKAALKKEVDAVNEQLEKGAITKEQAETKKTTLAQSRASNIEIKVAKEQEKLEILVQKKVDGQIKERDSSKTIVIHFNDSKFWSEKKKKGEKRTTSQFVLAFGANNLVTDEAIANSDFYYWQSKFFEWGSTYNTRIFKNDNLLHLKYGYSVMYNTINPTDNRYFVPVANGQTTLEVFPSELEEARFKNVYLVAPLHLEFDFSGNKSKNGNTGFSTHKAVRFGIGGYGGFRIKSKQKIYYNINDDKERVKSKGDFNASDFIYGLSTYIGYKETSLYFKYDLNPLFENNAIKQNNVSLGVRFDFN
jgi:hypothetical protein